jgi:uncharacterized protein (TIGR03435 family)
MNGRSMSGPPARTFRCAVLAIAALCASPVTAATPRAGFVSATVASGLSRPTAMAFAPDGRIFVAEQDGALRVIKDGVLLPQPFLQVTVSAIGERGLLGVAFDPLFLSNSFVYVHYTATTPTVHNRVSRFTAAGDVAAAGSEVPLLDLPTLAATNHNGGAIHFGPDGFLYVAVGDNAVAANAQSLTTPLGKLLRIARDGSIPPTNPFVGQTSGINQAIWALGLRNPFTFAFDPASGRLLINDVGQNAWEEINEGFPGANYGWPDSEGPTSHPAHVGPLYAYTHASTGGCAITGGAFYPVGPAQFPAEYAGDYFFADLCAGWIRQYDFTDGLVAGNFASGISAPVGLAIGPEGALYYLARGPGSGTGIVGRIDFTGSTVPTPPYSRRPTSRAVPTGRTAVPRHARPSAGTAQVTVAASADRDLRDETPRAASAAPPGTDEPLHAHLGPASASAHAAHAAGQQAETIAVPESERAAADAVAEPAVSAGPSRFQTADVTPSMPLERSIGLTADADGRIRITHATLRQLIQLASDLPVSRSHGSPAGANERLVGSMRDGVHVPPLQIANGPAWLDTQRFDIEAHAGPGRRSDDVRQMLHALLQERFGLVARFTRRPVEVLALERRPPGRWLLQAHTGDAPAPGGGSSVTPGAASMDGFADALTRVTGRTVLDRTGLGDDARIEFQWPLRDAADAAAAGRLDLASALGSPLGLVLRPIRVDAWVLTVERVEQPHAIAPAR